MLCMVAAFMIWVLGVLNHGIQSPSSAILSSIVEVPSHIAERVGHAVQQLCEHQEY